MSEKPAETPGTRARLMMRAADRAALATGLAGSGWPYASLVLAALDHDGAPLLLVSTLAEHTKNFLKDERVALLYDATTGLDEPLTGARATVLGRIAKTDDARHKARFTARHPSAEGYAGFRDFACYRVAVERAHLVAGFGAIHWIEAEALIVPLTPALAAAEAGLLAHMNQDHAAALDLYAQSFAGRAGTGWRMTGIDPDGLDLRRGGEVARVTFVERIEGPEEARRELVRLAAAARAAR